MSSAKRARFAHVVFDLDGTLVDSCDDLVAAVQHVLQRFGRPQPPRETIIGYIGEGARRLVERSFGAAEPALIDEALSVFRAFYSEHLLDRTRPYPEVPEMLRGLAGAGCVLSVLSNKPEAMSRALLAGLDLLGRFRAVVGGDTLATRKPDPGGLAHLSELSAVRLEQTLLVGDSSIDLETARAAAAPFCGVLWGFFPEKLLRAHPERVVARPLDLVAVAGA